MEDRIVLPGVVYDSPEPNPLSNLSSGACSPVDGPAGEASPLLDALQTTQPHIMYSSLKKQLGLEDRPEYFKTLQALRDIPSENKTHPADRLDNCSRQAWFFRNTKTNQIRVAANRCNLRWCPICAKARRFTISEAVGQYLLKCQGKRFITLTLKNSATPLAGQVDLLYMYFGYLRKKKLWKDNVRGGIWFFQITRNHTTGEWHPHLHVLVDSKWIEQKELSDQWLAITKNSYIVDIKRVKGDKKAAEYVARYGSRPGTLDGKSLAEGKEMITALHSRRLIGCFGTAKGLKFKPEPPADKDDWENVGSWFSVRHCLDFSDAAQLIWAAWKGGVGLGPGISCFGDSDPAPPPLSGETSDKKSTSKPAIVSTYKQLTFDWNKKG